MRKPSKTLSTKTVGYYFTEINDALYAMTGNPNIYLELFPDDENGTVSVIKVLDGHVYEETIVGTSKRLQEVLINELFIARFETPDPWYLK